MIGSAQVHNVGAHGAKLLQLGLEFGHPIKCIHIVIQSLVQVINTKINFRIQSLKCIMFIVINCYSRFLNALAKS